LPLGGSNGGGRLLGWLIGSGRLGWAGNTPSFAPELIPRGANGPFNARGLALLSD